MDIEIQTFERLLLKRRYDNVHFALLYELHLLAALYVQTCLGGGETGDSSIPTSFLLDICQTQVLLECPVNLSALLLFLPTLLSSKEGKLKSPSGDKRAVGARLQSTSSLGYGGDSLSVHGGKKYSKGTEAVDDHLEALLPACKRPKVGIHRSSRHGSCSHNGGHITEKGDPNSLYPLDAEPWYKTPDLHQLDVSLLNAVLISNPLAMLGLPFLVRNPGFTAKIYATDATIKMGQLLMEELVTLHSEFTQLFGQRASLASPPWFQHAGPSDLEQLNCAECGEHWQHLYSTDDIRACIARIHGLRYGEEASVNGQLKIKPSSSGFGIGSCNWVLKGAHRSLAYIGHSTFSANHSAPLDLPSLSSCEVLLFSTCEAADPQHEESPETRKESGVALPRKKSPESKAVQTASTESHQGTEGNTAHKQPPQLHSFSPASSLSPANVGSTAGNSMPPQKPLSTLHVPASSEKSVKVACEQQEVPKDATSSSALDEKVNEVCRAAVEAVSAGGSVLFPISMYGSFLEILEEILIQLRSAGMEVPVLYISPVAEKVLAYANTVPEWVSALRQEKLYAGEALFGFVDAVQEKRFHHYSALHSPDLLRCWQEPCVVFASHLSLRMGPAIQLLHRWRSNPLCLVVLTQPSVDVKVLLEPFEPFRIQVLHHPLILNITSSEVASMIRTLKPQLALIPKSLENLELSQRKGSGEFGGVSCYQLWQPYKIPRFQNDFEVDMTADLALQIQLKQIRSGKVAAARLSADLHVRDGRWILEMPSPSSSSGGVVRCLPRHQIRWGKVDVDTLLTAFKERQIHDVYVTERTIQDEQNLQDKMERKEVIIELTSPSPAKIEITSATISIHANEASLRRLIVEVLNSTLNVL
ncbi:hypothetical protein R1sor_018391 [Riccia sorocarpa]|uniref:Beta-Casp domain-containing protein n=1 Tax=Riccia sorocarpa TaxID=122646 RepID=A0ABD3IFS6_9MARC